MTQASWHLSPPWPWAWTLSLSDSPASFSGEGLCNVPAVSTARPPFRPELLRAVRWEDVAGVEARGGWIWIGGGRFVPLTEAFDARALRALAERLGPLPQARREAELAAWWRRRFSVARARRRLASALRRTRGIAVMNTLQVAGWAAISIGLLGEWFVPESPGEVFAPWRGPASSQMSWWLLLAWLSFAHVFSLVEAWNVHGRLHPARKEERTSLMFGALLLPPQALRLRAALLRPLAFEFSPLAAALAAGTREAARAAAGDTLRDAIYPARPEGLPEFFARQADRATALARPELERVLATEAAAGRGELAPTELLAAPKTFSPGVCAWCPRCEDGFVRIDGTCPHGVTLRKSG